MKFHIYEKRKKISDYLKPRKKIVLTYRRSLGKILGFGGGFITNISSNKELAEKGETKKIIELLTDIAKKNEAKVPFALSKKVKKQLENYEIKIYSSYQDIINSPFFKKECKESGIRLLPNNKYEIIN